VRVPDRQHPPGTLAPPLAPAPTTAANRASQLGIALARLFSPENDKSFHLPDQQALTSLTTFLGGAFLGRIGDRLGARTRLWLFLGTFLQALFTMAGAIAIWQSGQGSVASDRGTPSWTNALSFVGLAFISASMGLQGIMGKRVNTQFATTSACASPGLVFVLFNLCLLFSLRASQSC
jgi:MFS family permease